MLNYYLKIKKIFFMKNNIIISSNSYLFPTLNLWTKLNKYGNIEFDDYGNYGVSLLKNNDSHHVFSIFLQEQKTHSFNNFVNNIFNLIEKRCKNSNKILILVTRG